jgi:hypothetical protein
LGDKTITKQGTSDYTCLFDEAFTLPTHANFVFSLSKDSDRERSKPGRALFCHSPPVPETAHLALLLVQQARAVVAEVLLSPKTVLWRINLCQVGSGQSSSTTGPNREDH